MQTLPAKTVLFRPGDCVQGYVIPLRGRIDVCLTGPTGREILLYEVSPGQSCVQSTLGLLGGEDYSAEARTETEVEIVLLPKPLFMELVDRSESFRKLVFHAFATRLQSMMHLLEKVAFLRVEARLAEALLERRDAAGVVAATQAELAAMLGTGREVITRRLQSFSRAGLIEISRGAVSVRDADGLAERAQLND